MTTPTGFKFYKDSNLVDFADVFQPGNSETTTGFISGSTDLGNLFASGNSGYTTGYKNSIGTDLGSLFQQKAPFTVTNSLSGVQYALGTDNNTYAYAIFTDTINQGTVVKSEPNYTGNFYYIIVGGGGGGGGLQADTSHTNGGGGGGGVFEFTVGSPNTTIIVGGGGLGAYVTGNSSNSSGLNGGQSQIIYTSTLENICRCTGGTGGSRDARGAGGVSYFSNNSSPSTVLVNDVYVVATGGDGGDQTSGAPCTYNSGSGGISLNIPINSVSAYISNYYSGGGGGAKEQDESYSYSGEKGGGTDSSAPNTGLGGARGIKDATATNGTDGYGYGSGGGAGGWNGSPLAGGSGRQGIVIVYAQL